VGAKNEGGKTYPESVSNVRGKPPQWEKGAGGDKQVMEGRFRFTLYLGATEEKGFTEQNLTWVSLQGGT